MRLTLQPCSTRVCLPSPAAARPMPSRTCAPPSRTLMRATPSDKASTLPELNVNSISSSQSGLLASSSFSPGASDDLIFPSGARGAPASASARSQGVVVTVRNMTKRYDTQKGPFFAVKDVSLDIHPGTITALLGPSGSGKTTLMRLVAGLEEATSGQVYFGDEDMTARSVQDRELGFLFQGYALFRHMTVAENIAFGPRVRKMDIDIDARVEELLALVGLTGYGKRYPPQLSGGQRQRVALARALGCNPQLLLLDEPFGALDPLVRKALRGSLKEIVSSIGVTTIIVTHDQEEAWDLADEVIIFNRGRIEQRGMPEQITRHPKSPFVMNFVGGVLHLPSNCQFLRRMGLAVPQPYVMIRPAHIDVHKTFEGKKNICAATVKDKSRVGWLVNYTIVFDDGVDIELTVGRKEDELFYDFAAGDRVYLTADINNVVPFSPSEIDDPMFEEVVMLGARAA